MNTLTYILLFSFLEALVSFSSVVFLLMSATIARRFSHFFISFAVGVLLAVTFLDILPEAIEGARDYHDVAYWVIGGIVGFFILEKLLIWHHHNDKEDTEHFVQPHTGTLVLAGDLLHNFLDGIVIALTFLVSVPLGVATSIAVILHEVPQEIGDFSILLASGMSRMRAFVWNGIVSLSTIVGAVLTYFLSSVLEPVLPYALALVAGNFLYIAVADLIPELHKKGSSSFDGMLHVALILLGVVVLGFLLEGHAH